MSKIYALTFKGNQTTIVSDDIKELEKEIYEKWELFSTQNNFDSELNDYIDEEKLNETIYMYYDNANTQKIFATITEVKTNRGSSDMFIVNT